MVNVAILSVAASAWAGPITTLTMILIGIGALCAIAVIAWGTMRRRAKAAQIADADSHAARVAQGTADDAATPVATRDVPDSAPATATMGGPSTGATDDPPLTVLKGLGPKAAAQLATLGVGSIHQLAALSPAQVAEADAKMGSFAGRIERDRWVEQARLLAAGDVAGFERAFGKLGG